MNKKIVEPDDKLFQIFVLFITSECLISIIQAQCLDFVIESVN